jgi:hypothetical protein
MDDSFGVYPDGQDWPAAIFVDLEDAIEWALARFGADRFGIRHCAVAVPASLGRPRCLGAA